MYNPYPKFSVFVKANWWLLLISFVHFIQASNSEDLSPVIGVLVGSVLILFLMFIYWFVRYGNK